MQPISRVNAGAAQALTEAEKGAAAPKAQKPEEGTQGRPMRAAQDRYAPAERQEPYGRYWLGKDGDGQPKVFFTDPAKAADAPKKPKDAPDTGRAGRDKEAEGPGKAGKKEARCVGSTDRVDREIERLKKKKEELEKRLNTETDETKVRNLQRQLDQLKRELMEKDNDAYRKQHCTFTQLR